jgi:hypothetical protein
MGYEKIENANLKMKNRERLYEIRNAYEYTNSYIRSLFVFRKV